MNRLWRATIRWLALAVGMPWAVSAYDVVTGSREDYVVTWELGEIRMDVLLPTDQTFSDGTNHRTSIVAAMEVWNAQVGLVQFAPNVGAPGDYGVWNGNNEVVMDSTIDGYEFDQYTLAVAVSRNRGDRRVESDVIFNSAWIWDSYRGALLETAQDIRRVAIHELGHVLGLLHPDQANPPQQVTAIMNAVVSDLDGLQEDDIAGAQWLYGPPDFRPSNDDFADAEQIAAGTGGATVTGTNIGATRESGEPDHAGITAGRTVWWNWTAGETGTVTLTTEGSNFDTVMAVYTGPTVDSLVWVASNDDVVIGDVRTSAVTFNVVTGTTYHIAVAGWEGLTGRIRLNVLGTINAGFPRIVLQPRNVTVGAGGTARFFTEAAGDGPLSYQWQKSSGGGWLNLDDGDRYSGTQTTALAVFGTETLVGTEYFRVLVSNAHGSVASESALMTVEETLPVITALSDDTTVQQGATLQLRVTAEGSRSLDYQWYLNGAAVPGSEGKFANYFRSNAQPRHAGFYRVKVSSDLGFAWSDPIEVTVDSGPGIVRASGTYFVRSNGQLMFMTGGGPNRDSNRGTVVFLDRSASTLHTIDVNNDLTFYDPVQGQLVVLAGNAALSASAAIIDRDGSVFRKNSTSNNNLSLVADLVQDYAGGYNASYLDGYGQVWRLNRFVPEGRELVVDGVVKMAHHNASILLLKADGTVLIWGNNGAADFNDPTDSGLTDVIDIATGDYHTLFLKADGTLWGFGKNAYGEIGNGTKDTVTTPVQMATDVFAIAGGERESVWIKQDGSLWGTGQAARLALDTTEYPTRPVWLADGPLEAPVAPTGVVASDDVPLEVVRVNWDPVVGSSFYEVWRSTTDEVGSARLVRGRLEGTLFLDSQTVPGITYHYWVRAVNPAGASVFSASDSGLRNRLAPVFSQHPQSIDTLAGHDLQFSVEVTGSPDPVLQWQSRTAGATEWSDLTETETISGVDQAVLRLASVGTEWTNTELRCVATNSAANVVSGVAELQVAGPSRVLTAGGASAIHFVTADGTLWGRGWRVGDGTSEYRPYPARIMAGVVAISVRNGTQLFLKSDGTLWGLGDNAKQQLGDELPAEVLSPILVAEEVVSMSAARYFITYLKADGTLWIAGESVLESDGVVRVLDAARQVATDVVSVSAAETHCLFVKSDGSLWGGGSQRLGQLGNGVDLNEGTLGAVKLVDGGVAAAAAGGLFSTYLTTAGELWGTGSNYSNLLSPSTTPTFTSPVLIDDHVVHMAAGRQHLLYLKEGNELYGSGDARGGVLGLPDVSSGSKQLLRTDAVGVWAGAFRSLYLDTNGVLRGAGNNWGYALTADEVTEVTDFIPLAGGTEGVALPPNALRIATDPSGHRIELSWVPQAGDGTYQIWRGTSAEMAEADLLEPAWRAPRYSDAPPLGGVDYHYWVVSVPLLGEAREPVAATGERLPLRALSVDSEFLTAAVQGEVLRLAVTSDTAWSVAEAADWVSVEPAQGEGSGEIAITVDFNETEAGREVDLLINDVAVSVSQAANVGGAPSFLRQPQSVVMALGDTIAFEVEVLGLPRPTLQWYHNGEAIPDATGPVLRLPAVASADQGDYTVVALNLHGSTSSSTARATLLDATGRFVAGHETLADFVQPGGSVEIVNLLSVPADGVEFVRWSVLLPAGWSFLADTAGLSVEDRPAAGQAELLEWTWNAPAGETLGFSYSLQVPDGNAIDGSLVAYVEVTLDGESGAVLAQPDPLVVEVRPAYHSADTNRDWRLSLSELLRVIELYNTRSGTQRTGRYQVAEGTADGFNGDSSSADGAPLELPRYHSGDYNRDGHFSLSELLRVIELYNTRAGTTRTGTYRAAEGTDDGFAPGES